jgi:serine protease
MSVGDVSPADVGVIYILLYEQEADEAIAQASASSDGGSYTFAFNNVPPGQYQIFAGSDADNDLLICDAGEACGSWLTIDQPIVVNVNSDQENIDFPVDYLVTLPSINGATEIAQKAKDAGDLSRQRK